MLQVRAVLQQYYRNWYSAFMYYAAMGSGDPYHLPLNSWTTFLDDSQVWKCGGLSKCGRRGAEGLALRGSSEYCASKVRNGVGILQGRAVHEQERDARVQGNGPPPVPSLASPCSGPHLRRRNHLDTKPQNHLASLTCRLLTVTVRSCV